MIIRNSHAYCDESGNTGANLLDQKQPLFVTGGWLVRDAFIDATEQHIREYIKMLAPKDNELHGTQLLRNYIGTFGILNLIKDLQELCLPICQIVEKRMLLIGHIFSIFLKPQFNPLVPDSFEDYFEGKRELMEAVYDLPDGVLKEFAEAYDKLDRSLLLASLRNISTALSLRLETRLADLMMGSLLYMDAIIEHHNEGRIYHDSITLNTPNVASFHMFFQFLEEIGRKAKIARITLVHDESPQFVEAFPRIFEQFRDDDSNAEFKEGPRSVVHLGFKSLKDFRFANSKNEPILQAADVLVSAMNRYAVNVYKDRPNPTVLTDIARWLLTEPPKKVSIIRTSLSESFADKLYNSINAP
jgi:hypothetical protein